MVLLADELDFLVTRKQSVLYNLFDWPSRPNSKLVVVGVANTMDLPERLLPRISSRLGMARTVFQPYSVPQIEAIVRNRVGALGVFDPDALQMCARKVASVSGDVRRALMICRCAAAGGWAVQTAPRSRLFPGGLLRSCCNGLTRSGGQRREGTTRTKRGAARSSSSRLRAWACTSSTRQRAS